MVGIGAVGVFEMGDRLLEALALGQNSAEVASDLEMIRLEPGRLPERDEGLRRLSERGKGHAQEMPGFGVLRLGRHQRTAYGDGLVRPAG